MWNGENQTVRVFLRHNGLSLCRESHVIKGVQRVERFVCKSREGGKGRMERKEGGCNGPLPFVGRRNGKGERKSRNIYL